MKKLGALFLIVSFVLGNGPMVLLAQEVAETPEVVAVPEVVQAPEPEAEAEVAEAAEEVAPIEEEAPGLTFESIVENISSSISEIITPAAPEKSYTDIVVGEAYASEDAKFTVTFNVLPEGSHTVTIKTITLTSDEVALSGALSNIAYDVTSDMTDGEFAYDITMPMPEEAVLKFAEDRSDIAEAEVLTSLEDVDHFTIFFVTDGSDSVGFLIELPFSLSQLASLNSPDSNRLSKTLTWLNNAYDPTIFQEFLQDVNYPATSTISSATIEITLQRQSNVTAGDGVKLSMWDGTAFNTATAVNITPTNANVDQTFNITVPVSYINTPAKINNFKFRIYARTNFLSFTNKDTKINFIALRVTSGDVTALLAPATGISISTATTTNAYSWTPVAYATGYQLETCATNPGTSACGAALATTNASSTNITIALNSTERSNFFWHVRPSFNDGTFGAWSATNQLTIDNTKPLISYNLSGTLGLNNWYVSNVGIDFLCAETGSVQSGVALNVAGDATTTLELANQTFSSTPNTCVDFAGNIANATTTVGISIDKTVPVITAGTPSPAAPNGTNGWYTSAVTVPFTATDNVSGFSATNTLSIALASKTTSGSNSAHVLTSDLVSDWAGNTAIAATSGPYKVDVTNPGIAYFSRTLANIFGWNNTPVTVTWNCTDNANGSGVVSAQVSSTTATTGAGLNLIGKCTDNSGRTVSRNSSLDTTINIDQVMPVITIFGSNPITVEALTTYVDAGATSTDALSGVAGAIVVSNPVNTSLRGTYTVTYTSTDRADNATSSTRTVIVVDTIKPVLSLIGGTVTFVAGENFTDPGATALDNYDGDISGRIVATTNLSTTVAGTYTITYNVTDLSGNAADPITRTVVVLPQSNGPTSFGVGASIVSGGGGGGGGSNGPIAGTTGGLVLGASFGPSGSIFGTSTEQIWTRQAGFLGSTLLSKLLGVTPAPATSPTSVTGQVAGASKFMFTINLRQGMRGNDVLELQNGLTAEGYLKVTVTGFFGPMTLAAVKAYQVAHGITATGFVGPLTRAELNK